MTSTPILTTKMFNSVHYLFFLLTTAFSLVTIASGANWSAGLAKATKKTFKDYVKDNHPSASTQQTCVSQIEILSNDVSIQNAYASGEASCLNGYVFTCDFSTTTSVIESTCTSLGGSTFTANFDMSFYDSNYNKYYGSYVAVGICLGNLCFDNDAMSVVNSLSVVIGKNLEAAGFSYVQVIGRGLTQRGYGPMSAASTNRYNLGVVSLLAIITTAKLFLN